MLDCIIDATARRRAASRSQWLHTCSCQMLNATRSSCKRIAAVARCMDCRELQSTHQLLNALRIAGPAS